MRGKRQFKIRQDTIQGSHLEIVLVLVQGFIKNIRETATLRHLVCEQVAVKSLRVAPRRRRALCNT